MVQLLIWAVLSRWICQTALGFWSWIKNDINQTYALWIFIRATIWANWFTEIKLGPWFEALAKEEDI